MVGDWRAVSVMNVQMLPDSWTMDVRGEHFRICTGSNVHLRELERKLAQTSAYNHVECNPSSMWYIAPKSPNSARFATGLMAGFMFFTRRGVSDCNPSTAPSWELLLSVVVAAVGIQAQPHRRQGEFFDPMRSGSPHLAAGAGCASAS